MAFPRKRGELMSPESDEIHPRQRYSMCGSSVARVSVVFFSIVVLCGCGDLVPDETKSLLLPNFQRSEIFGFIAGLGTTFAAVPDLLAMLRRRSTAGMHPRMAAITGVFQILWIYYGLLIASRPVITWNLIAVAINFLSVGAYAYFLRKEKTDKRHAEVNSCAQHDP
jgi:MtN3 and saliva related transmembrane protein